MFKGFARVTDVLSKENLIAKLSSGCKAKEDWRIGTEHEKFGFKKKILDQLHSTIFRKYSVNYVQNTNGKK